MINKKLIITLLIISILGLLLGFSIGTKTQQSSMKDRFISILDDTNKDNISRISYDKFTLIVKMKHVDKKLYTEDDTIYEVYDRELVSELMDEFKVREIIIK